MRRFTEFSESNRSVEFPGTRLQTSPDAFVAIQELVPIASISPQSAASLAALYDLTLDEAMRGLRRFFRQSLGFR